MHDLVVRSLFLAILAATIATPFAWAQVPPSESRCDQLLEYFDYYGQSRGQGSDGARNMDRIGASIDCDRGDYREGIEILETLLRNKRIGIPAPEQDG